MFWSKAEVLQKTGPLKGLESPVADRGRGRQNQSMMNDWRHAHTHHACARGVGIYGIDGLLWIFQLSIPASWVMYSFYLFFRRE